MSGKPAPKLDTDTVIALLDLKPHPEGGFYRETFRDGPGSDGRAKSSLIYFLLKAQQISAWHRVDAAEAWHHYAGAPLRLSLWAPGRAAESLVLGGDLAAGHRPQLVVPTGVWQMAECLGTDGAYTLVGCSVAPGFEFTHFEMAAPGWQPEGAD